jgi:hypothetical protein
MGCILLCGEIRILYMAVNTTLYTFPRRLQALFSNMHTLHVSAFFVKPSSCVIYLVRVATQNNTDRNHLTIVVSYIARADVLKIKIYVTTPYIVRYSTK